MIWEIALLAIGVISESPERFPFFPSVFPPFFHFSPLALFTYHPCDSLVLPLFFLLLPAFLFAPYPTRNLHIPKPPCKTYQETSNFLLCFLLNRLGLVNLLKKKEEMQQVKELWRVHVRQGRRGGGRALSIGETFDDITEKAVWGCMRFMGV